MHIHILGVCGTFMGGIAAIAKAAGHTVTGCDANVYPPMSTQLVAQGIELIEGFGADQIELEPDVFVIGNVVARGNALMEEILNRGLPYISGPQWLAANVLRDRRVLAVAGTHGKTTTTSIAAWVIDQGELNPTFLIGGVAQNFGHSFRVTDSDYFIIEADEYDTAYFDKGPKFMHYLPELAIVNNIEFDHADIYRDLDAVKLAFRRFMNLVPENGRLIAGWDSPHVRAVVESFGERLFTRLETFGTERSAKWQVRNAEFGEGLSRFEVFCENQSWGEFQTPLVGEFNLLNCLAVIVAADAWGVSKEKISSALASFQNVKRRAEVRGEEKGVLVIDDFAHHPTAVRETLRALRARYRDRRLIAVFEPRSWSSRLAVFQDDYANAFAAADYVVIAAVFDSDKVTEKGRALDTRALIDAISQQGKPAFALPDAGEIVTHLVPELREGDVVAIMSNGGFGGIHDRILSALQSQV